MKRVLIAFMGVVLVSVMTSTAQASWLSDGIVLGSPLSRSHTECRMLRYQYVKDLRQEYSFQEQLRQDELNALRNGNLQISSRFGELRLQSQARINDMTRTLNELQCEDD
ncbi:MAG: hypothetical protein MJE68_09520 [Proteobacteria bacterium]|nr:hypothetical protein [Pseudomonadota bacterium]